MRRKVAAFCFLRQLLAAFKELIGVKRQTFRKILNKRQISAGLKGKVMPVGVRVVVSYRAMTAKVWL